MTWNYRIVRYKDRAGFGLHEAFYDDEGRPVARTADAVGFASGPDEGPAGVIASLKMALEDAEKRPVLDDVEIVDRSASAGQDRR